ncbi:hypothetical protein DFH07DRAFT_582874 [Mycena maculata]|uniref:Uncharacterized protein n=1 Tax=Mycena maculata TaxID=230809 RepID=A0AAD7N531_9AGAR|nr:hypothetical protein DFH07DRAFT_582874 [Mycena maculata]
MCIEGAMDTRLHGSSTVTWSTLYYFGALTYDHHSGSTLRVSNSVVLSLIHACVDKTFVDRHNLQSTLVNAYHVYAYDDDPTLFLAILSEVLCEQTRRSLGCNREPSLHGILELVLRNEPCTSCSRSIEPIALLPEDEPCIEIKDPQTDKVRKWELRTLSLLGMWRAINANDNTPSVEELEKLHAELVKDDEEQLVQRPYRAWSEALNAMEHVLCASFYSLGQILLYS